MYLQGESEFTKKRLKQKEKKSQIEIIGNKGKENLKI